MKRLLTILIITFFTVTIIYSQTDIGEDTKVNMPNDWGKKPQEQVNNSITKSNIPDYLLQQYKQAKQNHDNAEKLRIGNEIQKSFDPVIPPQKGTYEETRIINGPEPPFSQDWYNNDVQVYSGDVSYAAGYRTLDMKYGEDGWLYLAVAKRNVSGYNGYITLYRSSNAGSTWTSVISAANTSAYFGTVSICVDKRHLSNNDSMRILMFYTRSGSSNFDNASIEIFSVRRNGSSAFALNFASPASGNKYEYPTACSDGVYWDVATYFHIIAREVTNAGTQVGLRHFLSINWGLNYTNILINTSNTDMYPSAAYCEKGTGDDSIYIAVQRRITATESEVRAIITCEWLTPNHYVYYITSAPSGIKYERPCITVQQQNANVLRRVLITCTKNNIARYHNSTNGGRSWGVDYILGGSNMLADYTWCNSDSLTAGDGYAIACFVDQNGDSVTVRRGNMTGSLGATLYKRNSVMSTGSLAPVCAVYKNGTSKYSAFAYAGQGPSNVYFNQESLVTGVSPTNGNIPDRFVLEQNYPNPFNPNTIIKFSIPNAGNVKLTVFDITGRIVSIIADEEMKAGSYSVDFNASNLSSGIYFYKIEAGSFVETKKMTLIK
ncbi:MAG: T9SS C-terminal target domain-containing protein [Ignavibacteriae bacterium]|nr:MAG: T9SS C-terminal target domain-containing protein [Ignavibacteriota bacterium]